MSNKESIEQEEIDLLALINEGAQLSEIYALVSLAYSRAKIKEAIKGACTQLGNTISEKAKGVVGNIKENSRLYDELQEKRGRIVQGYEGTLTTVAQHYDSEIAHLLAEKAKLESENLSLAADCENLRGEKKRAEQEYKEGEQKPNGDTSKLITQMKREAEKLASQGDLEGAKAKINEYRKLKENYVMQTAEGMLEIAAISQQINANKEELRENKQKIAKIDEQISNIQQEAQQQLDSVKEVRDKEMIEVNGKTSIFRRMAMFASKTVTRTFNKGKAIENEVIAPMKAKIERKIPEIEAKLGTKLSAIKDKTTGTFKETLDKSIEAGKNVKRGAITRLAERIKNRSAEKRQKIAEKQEYLEGGRA